MRLGSDIAGWVQGLGSVVAIAVAVWIYYRGKADAAARTAATRHVLIWRHGDAIVSLCAVACENRKAVVTSSTKDAMEISRLLATSMPHKWDSFLDQITNAARIEDAVVLRFVQLSIHFESDLERLRSHRFGMNNAERLAWLESSTLRLSVDGMSTLKVLAEDFPPARDLLAEIRAMNS